jgi:hypothetical protein
MVTAFYKKAEKKFQAPGDVASGSAGVCLGYNFFKTPYLQAWGFEKVRMPIAGITALFLLVAGTP